MNLSEVLDNYNYSLANIVNWFKQLLMVVQWLHGEEIIHGDINLFNILTEADVRKIRLCDFEGYKEVEPYRSPESVRLDFEQIGATFSEILKNYINCASKDELITEEELEPLSSELDQENVELLRKMVYDTADVSTTEIDQFLLALGSNEEVRLKEREPLKPVRSEETNIDEKKAKVTDVIFGIKYLIFAIFVVFFACIVGYYYTGG
ncbi:unnamed protein product, partial [Mesorhabditis belari]|uniref:Protein kinase domain-containing protein n=1 Tax=Mesorhabditis belari TaxID=2138241 RepID=A0AAF3F3M3_9BILA